MGAFHPEVCGCHTGHKLRGSQLAPAAHRHHCGIIPSCSLYPRTSTAGHYDPDQMDESSIDRCGLVRISSCPRASGETSAPGSSSHRIWHKLIKCIGSICSGTSCQTNQELQPVVHTHRPIGCGASCLLKSSNGLSYSPVRPGARLPRCLQRTTCKRFQVSC